MQRSRAPSRGPLPSCSSRSVPFSVTVALAKTMTHRPRSSASHSALRTHSIRRSTTPRTSAASARSVWLVRLTKQVAAVGDSLSSRCPDVSAARAPAGLRTPSSRRRGGMTASPRWTSCRLGVREEQKRTVQPGHTCVSPSGDPVRPCRSSSAPMRTWKISQTRGATSQKRCVRQSSELTGTPAARPPHAHSQSSHAAIHKGKTKWRKGEGVTNGRSVRPAFVRRPARFCRSSSKSACSTSTNLHTFVRLASKMASMGADSASLGGNQARLRSSLASKHTRTCSLSSTEDTEARPPHASWRRSL